MQGYIATKIITIAALVKRPILTLEIFINSQINKFLRAYFDL